MLFCLGCFLKSWQGGWSGTTFAFRRRLGLFRPLLGEHCHNTIFAVGNGLDKFGRLRADFANFLWDLIAKVQ